MFTAIKYESRKKGKRQEGKSVGGEVSFYEQVSVPKKRNK